MKSWIYLLVICESTWIIMVVEMKTIKTETLKLNTKFKSGTTSITSYPVICTIFEWKKEGGGWKDELCGYLKVIKIQFFSIMLQITYMLIILSRRLWVKMELMFQRFINFLMRFFVTFNNYFMIKWLLILLTRWT